MTSDPRWTREESRHVDGEADAETTRRVEADWADRPARARRRGAWAAVTRLWREDAERKAPALDVDRMVADILSGSAREGRADRAETAARRYAAAALVLLGLGTLGALSIGPRRPAGDGPRAGIVQLETERLDLQRVREWERFQPSLPGEER